tara:strand:- start:3385 stop:4059 length:675 start_codon:yes stop_codon:yes gene_type:complete
MADFGLAPTFQNDTAQNAYDVHLLVNKSDGTIGDQQMNFSPETTLHFKSHGLMSELDVGKLEADKVISGADATASYYSFNDYSKAVTQDYNEAMKGAASVYTDIMNVVDPGGSSSTMRPVEIDGVYDINNLNWQFTDRFLETAVQSAENYDRMTGSDELAPLIDQAQAARQELANAGANVRGAAVIFFSDVKAPAPGMDPIEGVDLEQYEIQSGATDAMLTQKM